MKNKRALLLLLTANIISGFAQGISMLSIPWYFMQVLDAYSTFGIICWVVTFGTVFWSLYAGSLIDRYSRKLVFVYINICGAIVLVTVAVFGYLSGSVPVPLVALVFAATVFIYNIHYPLLYAFGQEISEKHNYGKMNAYIEIQGQATSVFAGAIGAILISGTQNQAVNLLGFNLHLPFDIAKWELHEIFMMDAVSYMVAIILIAMIKYTPAEVVTVHTGKVMERIKMGVAFLKKHPLVFLFGNMSHAIFVILLVEVHLLLSPYVINHLEKGADVYASADVYYAIGALFAGFGIRAMFKNKHPVRSVIVLMLITVASLFLVAFTKSVIVFFAFSVIIGVTNAGTRILRITYLFNLVPNNMMGRTGSVFQGINILFRLVFLGLFSIPFFARGSNITWAYFIGGVFILLSCLPLILKYKKLTQ